MLGVSIIGRNRVLFKGDLCFVLWLVSMSLSLVESYERFPVEISELQHADVFAEAPAAARASVPVVLHLKVQRCSEPQRHVLQCGDGSAMDVHPASAEGKDDFAAFPIAPEKQHRPVLFNVESGAF